MPGVSALNPFADGAAYIDGTYVPISEARIPIMDRGFTRSDATYDVTHVWKGYIFRLEDYLDRFERNCASLRFKLPHSREEIREILLECVRRTGLRDSYVQMTCTRGIPPKGSRDPRQAENRFYAFAVPFVWIATPEQQEIGYNLHISRIQRIPPESVDPTTKNFHWLDLTMGLFEAFDAGCDIEVLVDGKGNVTEGPGFNVFALTAGRLTTPASGVFDGMTRRTVIELCRETNIALIETELSITDIRKADEVFISSTAGGIIPITKLDGIAVGDGNPGPLTKRLQTLFWARKEAGWLGLKIEYND